MVISINLNGASRSLVNRLHMSVVGSLTYIRVRLKSAFWKYILATGVFPALIQATDSYIKLSLK